MELHIEAQHTEVEPTLRDWIGARCEALNTPHADIVHARVALVKHPRHLGVMRPVSSSRCLARSSM